MMRKRPSVFIIVIVFVATCPVNPPAHVFADEEAEYILEDIAGPAIDYSDFLIPDKGRGGRKTIRDREDVPTPAQDSERKDTGAGPGDRRDDSKKAPASEIVKYSSRQRQIAEKARLAADKGLMDAFDDDYIEILTDGSETPLGAKRSLEYARPKFTGRDYLTLSKGQRMGVLRCYIEYARRHAVVIGKGPPVYYKKLETFYDKHHILENEDFYMVLKTLIIMENDWSQWGMTKDEVALEWLGKEMHQINKDRLKGR